MAVVLGLTTTAAMAVGTTTVLQRGRAFSVGEVEIARSGTVTFTNDDLFVHQIYVSSPEFTFESDEQQPGTTIQVLFPRSGRFLVMCRIHPKMRLAVNVQ